MNVLAAQLGFTVAAAAAATTPPPKGLEGASLLDARAPIFAAIHPTELADGFALVERLGGLFPDAAQALARWRDGLGFYTFDDGELRESGISTSAPVLASLGLADPDEGGPRKGARGVLVRHRFVIRLLDDERFARAALAVLAASEASVARFDDGAPPAVPAWAAGRDVQALARRAGVLLFARTRTGALVAVRRAGDYAIVDYGEPSRGPAGKSEPRREIAGALARLVAPPRPPLGDALARGTRPLLASDDVALALVVEPGALGPLLPGTACSRDWSASDGAFFEDAALLLRVHPNQSRVDLVWSLTPLGRTRLGGAGSDDGIIDARAVAGDGVAAAGLLLDEFDAVRDAPRPPVLSRGLDHAVDGARACGAAGWLAAATRYWPQLAALEVEKQTAAPLANLRNVVAVVRRPGGAQRSWQQSTVLLGSLPGADEPSVTALASTAEASTLGRDLRPARRPARPGARGTIGFLHVNLGNLVESWGTAHPPAAALGQLGGDMVLDGNFVRLELTLSARR